MFFILVTFLVLPNHISDTVDGTNLEVQDVEKVDSLTDEME